MAKDDKSSFKKEVAFHTLDTINMWINNCDMKVSIILGFYAAIITVALSTDFINLQSSIWSYSIKNINFWYGIYLALYTIAVVCFFVGLLYLLNVILPRIIIKPTGKKASDGFKSIMFYESIKKYYWNFDAYKTKVHKTYDEEDIVDDLLFQIHSAAIICANKFKFQKIGLRLSAVSFYCFSLLVVVGIIIT